MSHSVVFNPVSDAVSCATSPELDAYWLERWQAVLNSSLAQALASLRQTFGGAVDLHGVPGWLTSQRGVHALATAGCVFATLDYFNWPASPPDDSRVLHAYLQQRHLDCWRQNAPALLEWQAVQQRVPEEWLPHSLVERQLAARLRQHPAVARAEVAATLSLRPQGGVSWLRDRSQHHWRAVRDRIAAGECCPVAVFASTGPRALLAFADGAEVRCYDPDDSSLVTSISPTSVDGLLRLRYAPAAPPLNTGQRVADVVGLGRTAWRLSRSWRAFRRASH